MAGFQVIMYGRFWVITEDPTRKVFTAHTRHEVQELLTDALKNLKSGIPIINEKQTVSNFLTHWLEQVIKTRVRPKTLRTYSDIVKLHISPAIGEVPLGTILFT